MRPEGSSGTRGGGGVQISDYGTIFAAVVSMLIPCLVVYMVFQRQLMQGVIAGALKG